MTRLISTAIAVLLMQRNAVARRLTSHLGLEGVVSEDLSANSSRKGRSGDQCCADHWYDASASWCSCSVFEEDPELTEHYCKLANYPRSLKDVTPSCGGVGKSNAEIAHCLLKKDKCISCSAARLADVCREAKSCSVLRDDQVSMTKMCKLVKDKMLLQGVVATPKLVAKLLYEGTPRVACTEDEISEMCGGVEPLCPLFTSHAKMVQEYCGMIVDKKTAEHRKVFTLELASEILGQKGVTCSARDVSAICGVPPPEEPYQSPCPELESSRLADSICRAIHHKERLNTGSLATGQSASQGLASTRGITCSAEDITKICKHLKWD
eukprot:CAMPEP_0197878480 /NCGR_PEP_ID=MMETSP1439-20131203/6860_1 /TAXON_ID=66791 /ORGANISM="Gonyaulax spinifera, Strain CCMP409" /LENGTH=323 /DNA_ID=CAMNT_0043497901 /DNA_START=82 /DNA_END=1053 /DNA_ORIENTATION=+